MKKVLLILCTLITLATSVANAETYVEAFTVDYRGDSNESFRGRNFYLEQSLSRSDSAFVNLYSDSLYKSGYLGLARMFGDLQLGLGIGEARYDVDGLTESSLGYNPWAWYASNGFEAYAEYEYLSDEREGYYYRGYATKDIGKYFFAGVYSERSVGTGPLVGIKFDAEKGFGIRGYLARPVFNKTSDLEEMTDTMAYVTLSYTF